MKIEERVQNLNENMQNNETKQFIFSFAKQSKHFFRIFVFFQFREAIENRRNRWPVSYSFVFRETKKLRNCQPYCRCPHSHCRVRLRGQGVSIANDFDGTVPA